MVGASTGMRVIPAWAGNTALITDGVVDNPGHPRVGGEHINVTDGGRALDGSSPRGRGTLGQPDQLGGHVRVIPAWAGNTKSLLFRHHSSPGHPRVGGEHSVERAKAPSSDGSSPRGRGTHADRQRDVPQGRVIPAWAGNTVDVVALERADAGHPRVGGEHPTSSNASARRSGSSPRGRGTPRPRMRRRTSRRVIPAWAGNTRTSGCCPPRPTGHPRVGGEHAERAINQQARDGSSPRGRGTRFARRWRRGAGAGHPRVGGEHAGVPWRAADYGGSSPRGRGTRSRRGPRSAR